jgi:hypothetical protein
MSVATVTLLTLIVGLMLFDLATVRGSKRALALQGLVFMAGGVLVARPAWATSLAHTFGIGRGVDFILYPTVLWLVRETLAARRARKELEGRLEEAVRALALRSAEHASTAGTQPAIPAEHVPRTEESS